jgi:gamma-glutamylcyclotransferase (GGCT)/AIG2-like uncharacterized protein YtfP
MTDMFPILVYGTLRPTGGNYENILEGYTVHEELVTLDGFTMYAYSGFPYVAVGGNTIEANLIYIHPSLYTDVMRNLDRLEGYSGPGRANHYDRILHTFTLEGEEIQAWMYVVNGDLKADVEANLPVIEDGNWLAHAYFMRLLRQMEREQAAVEAAEVTE